MPSCISTHSCCSPGLPGTSPLHLLPRGLPRCAHHPHLLARLTDPVLTTHRPQGPGCVASTALPPAQQWPRPRQGSEPTPLLAIWCDFQASHTCSSLKQDQRLGQPVPPGPPSQGRGPALPLASPLGAALAHGGPQWFLWMTLHRDPGQHLLLKAIPGPRCLEMVSHALSPQCQGDSNRVPELVPGCSLLGQK